MRIKDGSTVPNVAAMLPRTPFSLFPVKIEIWLMRPEIRSYSATYAYRLPLFRLWRSLPIHHQR